MRLGDFGTNVQAQAKTFTTSANLAAEKRLEEPFKRRRFNVFSGIVDGKLKLSVFGSGAHMNRRILPPVDERVAE